MHTTPSPSILTKPSWNFTKPPPSLIQHLNTLWSNLTVAPPFPLVLLCLEEEEGDPCKIFTSTQKYCAAALPSIPGRPRHLLDPSHPPHRPPGPTRAPPWAPPFPNRPCQLTPHPLWNKRLPTPPASLITPIRFPYHHLTIPEHQDCPLALYQRRREETLALNLRRRRVECH
jgi:hypothetical protein